ncbi:transcriptional activator of glycolytic enzymes-domain-containing protein [Lipomyces arxii]|uniref:transcriptional activator of glycolytic enzymes-domain-containing protein n=1 Tax=Lipomyces arxii TaxID=56418 RepID=UPI0034CDDAD4
MADYRPFDDGLAGVVVTGNAGPGGSANPRTTLLSQTYNPGGQQQQQQHSLRQVQVQQVQQQQQHQQQQYDPQIDKIQKSLDSLHNKVDTLQRIVEQRLSNEAAARSTTSYLNSLLDRQRRGISVLQNSVGGVQPGLGVDPDVGNGASGLLGTPDVDMHDPRLMSLPSTESMRSVGHNDSSGTSMLGDPMDAVVGTQTQDGSQRSSNGTNGQADTTNNGVTGPPSVLNASQLNNNLLMSVSTHGNTVSNPVTPMRSHHRRRSSMHLDAQYKMDRATQSVDRFWEEWTIGINGAPSIQALNATFRASWRSEVAERKFYSQRLVLVRTIEWMARTRHISASEAVDELEKRRRNENISLSRLCRILREEETKRQE